MRRLYPNYKGSRSKNIDPSCRNHGSCPWCKNNRLFFDKKRRQVMLDEYWEAMEILDEFKDEESFIKNFLKDTEFQEFIIEEEVVSGKKFNQN